MHTATIKVGTNLSFNDVPDGENLTHVWKSEDRDAIEKALGIPADSFTGALVNVAGAAYQTVWLSNEHRHFDLRAGYCLVQYEGQSL
jgi:hypothetical protein